MGGCGGEQNGVSPFRNRFTRQQHVHVIVERVVDDNVAIVVNDGGLPAGWPALFLLRGYAVKGERLPIGDMLLCCFALYLLTPVLMAMGSASAVAAIVNEWGSGTSNPLAGCLHPSFG